VKLFIISPRFPYPIEKGDKLRLYHQIRYLSRRFKIYLLSLSDIEVEQEHLDHIRQFVEEVHVFRLYKGGIFWSIFSRFFTGLPLQVLYFYDHRIKNKISRLHKRIKPEVTYNQLIRTTEYAKDLPGWKVMDYMDAFSTGMDKRVESCGFPMKWVYQLERKRLIRYEKRIYPYFDRHAIISDQDRRRLQKHIKRDISIIPNGVDTDYFKPLPTEKKYDICFIGNMGYRPNIIAAEYLVKEVLPALLKKRPQLRLVLAGTRPDPKVKKLANRNVIVTGWLEDIRSAYRESGIFVAPIFTGIGQQNKILEAMSMAIPCVCTSSVNNPIGTEEGKQVLVADSAEDFVTQIIWLLEHPEKAQKMGLEGREFVKGKYGWESQVDKLITLFEGNDDRQ
jgi:sugar transferase (PEP-CTERM/EpsH1 system associated)